MRREAAAAASVATRIRIGLAAAAAAVVLAAVLAPLAFTRPGAGARTLAFETVADVPVSATAVLTPADWGTRIDLDCRYESPASDATDAADVPGDGWPYALVVVDHDGNRTELSSWRASPGVTARLEAGTALDLDDIASLEITGVESGNVLLSADAD